MSEKSSSGCGLFTVAALVTIVFVTLKLIPVEPVAHWSWWRVLSPIPIYFAIEILFIIIVMFIAVIGAILKSL